MFNTGFVMPGFGGPYTQQTAVPNLDKKSFCQTLTVEQANSLRQHAEEFSLAITERDKWKAICMHRDPATGDTTLQSNDDGSVTCLICGEKFNLLTDNITDEDIANATNNLLDVIQSCKALYLDMPAESATNFFSIIALIKKIPGLFKIASNNYIQHENVFKGATMNGPNLINSWYALNNMPGGWGMGMPNMMGMPGMMGQPMYQNPMAGQPVAPAMFGAPTAPGANPFFTQPGAVQQPQPVMGQQPVGYQPQMQQYQYTPTQATQAATLAQPTTVQPLPAAPATPGAAQPTAQTATTDGANVNVTSTFTA